MIDNRQPALIEAADFRDAMACMASSVCLVTVRQGDKQLGRTVTAVLSLSLEPPSVLVSIDAASELAKAVIQAKGFSFSLLSSAQRDIADAFAGHVAPQDRFKIGDWAQWPSGHPKLGAAVIGMDCQLGNYINMGDHLLFVGYATSVETDAHSEPLVWHKRKYRALEPV